MGTFEDGMGVAYGEDLEGSATIRGATYTGERIADAPILEVELEVQIPDEAPYTVTRRLAIALAAMGDWRPGKVWPVHVDPADRTRVMVG
jgi:hypothetical protein